MKYLFIRVCLKEPKHNVLFNTLKSSSAVSQISWSLYFITASLSRFHLTSLLRFWFPLPLSVNEGVYTSHIIIIIENSCIFDA